MAVLDLNWEDIYVSEEVTEDLPGVTDLLVDGFGNTSVVDGTDLFTYVSAMLLCVHRYFISNYPEIFDIDQTPFLSYIQSQLGMTIPLSDNIDAVQFLREWQNFLSRKGSISAYPYIAGLVNSPIDIEYPKDLIFRWSGSRSCWSGAQSSMGLLPWDVTRLARFRDGIMWAAYTYIVDVLQAQEIPDLDDLYNLLDFVHPAGMQMFGVLRFNYMISAEAQGYQGSIEYKSQLTETQYAELSASWPTWDNNWLWSTNDRWSMHNGTLPYYNTSIIVS